MRRSLSLKREALTALGDTDLTEVGGGCIPALSCPIQRCLPEVVLTQNCPSRTGC